MTKRQLVDEIVSINQSAKPGFLAKFDDVELDEYLQHLLLAQSPRLTGDPHRYDHYFAGCPAVAAAAPQPDEPDPLFDTDRGDQDGQDEPPGTLDLHVSPSAFFKESYEAKAS